MTVIMYIVNFIRVKWTVFVWCLIDRDELNVGSLLTRKQWWTFFSCLQLLA